MLWLALYFPRLPLECLSSWLERGTPCAVTSGGKVVVCNEPARACGVEPGMALTAAAALTPALMHRERDSAAEAAALSGLANWALGYSSLTVVRPPSALLLEIGGSLKLLGGLHAALRTLHRALAAQGHHVLPGCAPTLTAALLLAHTGDPAPVQQDTLRARLSPLPIHVLTAAGVEEKNLSALALLGIRTVGEAWALPRDGLARRYGQTLLQALDGALGMKGEAFEPYRAPETFSAYADFGGAVEGSEALLFPARRLINQLCGWLAASHNGVRCYTIALRHEDSPSTVLRIGMAEPARDPARLLLLFRERCSRLELKKPACGMQLNADEVLGMDGANTELFATVNNASDVLQLLERLQSRLGPDAVTGISAEHDPRPEQASRAAPIGQAGAVLPPALRPLWLLPHPLPLGDGEPLSWKGQPVALLRGPERISSGWWDGNRVNRDYFIARRGGKPGGETVWIYREPGRGWFLHGLYS